MQGAAGGWRWKVMGRPWAWQCARHEAGDDGDDGDDGGDGDGDGDGDNDDDDDIVAVK